MLRNQRFDDRGDHADKPEIHEWFTAPADSFVNYGLGNYLRRYMQCDWNASYAIAKPNRPDWRRPLGSISLSQIHAGLSTALSLGNFRTYRGGFDWPILPNGMAARHRGCPVTTRRAAALRRFPASKSKETPMDMSGEGPRANAVVGLVARWPAGWFGIAAAGERA